MLKFCFLLKNYQSKNLCIFRTKEGRRAIRSRDGGNFDNVRKWIMRSGEQRLLCNKKNASSDKNKQWLSTLKRQRQLFIVGGGAVMVLVCKGAEFEGCGVTGTCGPTTGSESPQSHGMTDELLTSRWFLYLSTINSYNTFCINS